MSADLRYCIVNINGSINDTNGKPQLAIINDATETDKPDVTAANVLNFKDFAEKYLQEHPDYGYRRRSLHRGRYGYRYIYE